VLAGPRGQRGEGTGAGVRPLGVGDGTARGSDTGLAVGVTDGDGSGTGLAAGVDD
jgi:hypothetical protein